MSARRLWTIVRLELLQRVRTVAWYVMLGVFALLLVVVTVLAFLAFASFDGAEAGSGVYSTVVYITLLLVVLVSPTLSGNAINGSRESATLAPVQVTLATTGEILLGTFLAAWITGLAFVAVSVPFLIVATLGGGVDVVTVLVSIVVLIVEIGVVAGLGVAFSGILARPLFSVATTYLVVAALTVGTLIAFGLGGSASASQATSTTRYWEWDDATGQPACEDGSASCPPSEHVCGEWMTDTYSVSRFDRVWWVLAANPFVVLGDAIPTRFDANGYPVDLFGWVKTGVRGAQIAPDLAYVYDECDGEAPVDTFETPEEIVAGTVPSWFVGLGLQVLLTAGLLWWAGARTRTPARTLPPGTRIA